MKGTEMRILILLFLSAIIFSGCAHKTTHEYCSAPENTSRYKDYEQCYREVSSKGGPSSASRVIGNFFKDVGDGVKKSNKNETNCTTTVNGNTATTNCD